METQEDEYKHNIWEIYRKEWAIANPEKRTELEKRMGRWQELMKNGLPAMQAYYKAMEEELASGVAKEPSGKQVAIPSAPRQRKAPVIFLSFVLVAAIIYGVVITGDRNTLNTELESVHNELGVTQSNLSSTKQRLDSAQSSLTSTKENLDSTQSELASTKQTLTSTQAELATAQSELGSTKQILTTTQSELSSTQSELDSTKQSLDSTQASLTSARHSLTVVQNELQDVEAKLNLYKETTGIDDITSNVQPLYEKGGESLFSREDVYLTNSLVGTNPTFRELKAFLLADPTDDETYTFTFQCANFAEMLHNNAEADSIKAAFVAVFFEGEAIGHALNAFKTKDKGLVYVDCGGRGLFQFQTREYDKIAYVMKGKEYGLISIDSDVSPKYSYYEQMGKSSGSGWESLGIVSRIEIYW